MEKDKCFGEILNDVREKKINRPIAGQLNTNPIRNKFHFFESEDSKHLDILLISETKINESFPSAQFLLDGFSRPYRLDRFANGGGILLYVIDDISSCLLPEYKLQDNTECLFIEINIIKKKWLFCCSYNPNKNNISMRRHCLSKGLGTYISQYDITLCSWEISMLRVRIQYLMIFLMFTIYLALLKNQHVSKTLIIHPV